jgi:membrane fusion protein, multidrug efflux system
MKYRTKDVVSMFRRNTFIVSLLTLVAPLSGCKDKEEARPATPPEVEVVSVEQKDVPIYRDWVGTLQGEVNATISAQVSGYLISRLYNEGRAVTNGQVLFQIEPAPFDAALAKAKAQVTEAEARKGKTVLDVRRYTPLAKTQAISQQELDDAIQKDKAADGDVASAQAAVQTAELNLAFTTIRSPVDGIAGVAQAQIGDLLGPGAGALTTVTKSNPIRVYFSVSQQLMTELAERVLAEGREIRTGEGPPLELVLASGSMYPLKGKFRFANNQVDVKTGTIQVVGEFPNPRELLLPGMFTRVRVLLNTETNALLVPQRAVTDMQSRYLIALVGADNKVSIRPVTVGERVGQEWIITGNVKAGDRVVAEGVQKVREGAVVNPVPFGEKTATVPTGAEVKK